MDNPKKKNTPPSEAKHTIILKFLNGFSCIDKDIQIHIYTGMRTSDKKFHTWACLYTFLVLTPVPCPFDSHSGVQLSM